MYSAYFKHPFPQTLKQEAFMVVLDIAELELLNMLDWLGLIIQL